MNSKLFIPFQDYNFVGGPSTFMVNLKHYLDKVGFKYTSNVEEADFIFFPVAYQREVLDRIKKKKGAIIQRLDGTYYDGFTKEQIEFGEYIKEVYLKYANFVIFQSNYSKSQCFEVMGEIPESKYSIIYNGVDKSIFYPNKEVKPAGKKIKFITVGSLRDLEMVEPIIKALDALKQGYDFELNVVGPIKNKEIENVINRDYVIHHGSKNSAEVADLLRECDVFLHSQINDNCPNVILEAISVGLPVVGFDSGAMSELLFFSKDLLSFVSNDVIQKYKDYNINDFKDKIVLCLNNIDNYKNIAYKHSHLYSFEETGEKYLNVFNKPQNTNIINRLSNLWK